MKIDKKTGLIVGVPFHASSHCDERPTQKIDLIVIHNISLPAGKFGNDYVDQFFLGKLNCDLDPNFDALGLREMQVSSHLFIRRQGDIIQYVPFRKRAWHAGVSSFEGRENCNDFSIGIELEGTDTLPYEAVQYQQLAKVIAALIASYEIPAKNIVGHSDIAPGRKTDPGPAFDWQQLEYIPRT